VSADHVDAILEQWLRERPDLDATPMAVIGRISRAAQLVQRRLEQVFEEHGLTGGLFDVLAALRRSGDPYELSPTELFATTMVTSGGMTKRLDRLEELGLVERRDDPRDRRGVVVRLTADGKTLIDRALTSHLANEEAILSVLSQAERRRLADLLRKLLRSIEGERPPGRG
jgi:DNA-binding MarR family transcriptional regulator